MIDIRISTPAAQMPSQPVVNDNAFTTLATWFQYLNTQDPHPEESILQLLTVLQSPSLSITITGVTPLDETEEIVAVYLNQPGGSRTVYCSHGYTSELQLSIPQGDTYEVMFALKTENQPVRWYRSGHINDMVLKQENTGVWSQGIKLPSSLTPRIDFKTGPIFLVITPPSQTTETNFCLDLAELCILTDKLPTDLHLPLLSLGGYPSVHVCVSYAHDYQDPDFAHDYHVEFAAQAIHQRKFRLSHGWTEEGPPPLAEQIITYLKRFLLCYQQFHQLHAHFAFFEQVPHPLPLYTCTWSFPSVLLQHHLIRWTLSGNHAFSYQNTHTHETFAGAPYLHTSHVPPFHPDLITQTLQKLTPFLEKIQLELYTC